MPTACLGADSNDTRVLAFRALYLGAHPDSEMLSAIERAGSDDPKGVRAALAATRDFPGVTGTISDAPGERVPRKSVTILSVAGGQRRFVTEIVPSRVPAP